MIVNKKYRLCLKIYYYIVLEGRVKWGNLLAFSSFLNSNSNTNVLLLLKYTEIKLSKSPNPIMFKFQDNGWILSDGARIKNFCKFFKIILSRKYIYIHVYIHIYSDQKWYKWSKKKLPTYFQQYLEF